MRRSRRRHLSAPDRRGAVLQRRTLSARPAELPIAQKIPFGTTAWRTSMDRRQVVECANSATKGGFTDISRGFVRVFGLVKVGFLLFGFTIAAYNARPRPELPGKASRRDAHQTTDENGASGLGSGRSPCHASRTLEQATGPPG